ncbi:arabinogalactan oligomer/maltooligosaccharide transport system substrate-binding protein [Arthrobacter pigmenti]|uniref:Arabinogalactan oligomer/maltooligosaccharide transport system substrate-binding protein n=1 Tax=Arthrobacter pigmenti TaxID=271432 RepID=A0A846RK29_9MICC|nr:maltose ABC transporter substrate-binding protein [Arthrobacter pigmenti]NJC23593.1 arabinogalactan oligomer/maltooligosaccharide transport system substrate-binding protein [Arthrobacter pigmenti]
MKVLKTSRRAFATAAVSVAVMAMTACGSGSNDASPGESSAPSDLAEGGSTTLTMWVDAERAPALEEIAASFKEDTGIQVDLAVKDFAAVRDDFITQVPTGNGPDLIVGPHDWIGTFIENGVVAPIELGDKAAEFQESAIQAMSYNGNLYGVPYAVENIALLRNTDLVGEPAATFAEVIENGQAVVEAGDAEFPFLVGLDPKQADPYHMYPFQTSMGVPVFAQNDDGSYDPTKLLLGEPNGVEFAKKLVEWGDSGMGILNSNITGDIAKEKFIAGESPYFLTGPWNVPAAQEAGINLAIDPLPTVGDQPAQPFIGVNGFFISSQSSNALAANEFAVNYLTTEAAQDALFSVGGRPPALTASFEKAASDPIVAAFGEIGANGVPMPAVPEMQAVWADWGATELALIKGTVEPEEAWTTMVANIEQKIAAG